MFCNNFVYKLNGYYLLVELNRPFWKRLFEISFVIIAYRSILICKISWILISLMSSIASVLKSCAYCHKKLSFYIMQIYFLNKQI